MKKTFQLIDSPINKKNGYKLEIYYAKDKNGIYCISPFSKMKEADKTTFQILDKGFQGRLAKDKSHYYLDGKIIEEDNIKKIAGEYLWKNF